VVGNPAEVTESIGRYAERARTSSSFRLTMGSRGAKGHMPTSSSSRSPGVPVTRRAVESFRKPIE